VSFTGSYTEVKPCVTYRQTFIEKVGFHPLCKFDALSELKLTSGYISLFLTNSFTVGVDFEFQHEFHLVLQLSSKGSVHEGSRKVRFAPISLAQFILRLTTCKFKFSAMHRELKIISGKNCFFTLILFLTS